MCGRADYNPIAKSCTRKLKCADARCLRSKVGQRFMIERECCCPSAKACTPQRFSVEITGNVVGGPTGSFFFEYDVCTFSVLDKDNTSTVFRTSVPAEVTTSFAFDPLPITEVLVSSGTLDPNFWVYRQNNTVNSVELNAATQTNPNTLPDDFIVLNGSFVEQFNEGGVWSLLNNSVSFQNALEETLTLENASITINQVIT